MRGRDAEGSRTNSGRRILQFSRGWRLARARESREHAPSNDFRDNWPVNFPGKLIGSIVDWNSSRARAPATKIYKISRKLLAYGDIIRMALNGELLKFIIRTSVINFPFVNSRNFDFYRWRVPCLSNTHSDIPFESVFNKITNAWLRVSSNKKMRSC